MIDLLESLLSAEFIRAFALTLFHSLWQGALFAVVTAGLILILRKYRPALRYAVLYALMILFPVFLIATFLVVYHPESVQGTIRKNYQTSSLQAADYQAGEMLAAAGTDPVKALYLSVVQFFENNARFFVLVWLAGFLLFLVRFTGSVFYVYRLKNSQVFKVDYQWNTRLMRLSERLGLDKTVRLAESGLARVPMTIGYLKPVILLPIGTLSGVPPQQIDAILLHELAHILRKDYLLNIIQSVIELLFFYHPFTWWISGLIRQEREHICDDLAVNINQDHINYIKALTTMEELNSKSPLLANAITGSKKKLLIRVKRLIKPVKMRKGIGEGIIAFLLLISLVSALSLNALSVVPSSFDLTGRESGERLYNFLPFTPGPPDTITAVSSTGKVKISVYTDTVSEGQKETLEMIAESLDKQAGQHGKLQKSVIVRVDDGNVNERINKEERKVIFIGQSDSSGVAADSMVVIYSENCTPHPCGPNEYRVMHGIPVPAEAPEMQYFYANPGVAPGKDVKIQVYSYKNDSVDSLIIVNPGVDMNWSEVEGFNLDSEEMQEMLRAQQFDFQEYELSAEEMQDQMKDIQIEMEREVPDRGFEHMAFSPEPRIPAAEKIIRQELRDDGLTERGRKYVIEVDAKAMYINGEKQPKEIYRKYSKLVESLEGIQLEGEETYKLIF
jgi:bla regulator protein blaR1